MGPCSLPLHRAPAPRPPCCWVWDPRVSAHGWEPEQETPAPAPGQPWAHSSLPHGARSQSSLCPMDWEVSWGGGTLGSGLWRQGVPGQPQGVGGLGYFRLGAEGSATHLLIAEQQQLLEWLQLGLPGSRRGSTQPSSAPGAGPVRPTEGRRARGTSLRAPRPLADRETEAQSSSASWEEAPGCPPARALHRVPAWPGCCCHAPLPSPAACSRNKQRMSLAAKQTKGASSQGCGKPGQGTGAGRARSPQGCSQGEDTCPHSSRAERPVAMGSPAFALGLLQGTHHPGAFSLSPKHHPQQSELPRVDELRASPRVTAGQTNEGHYLQNTSLLKI